MYIQFTINQNKETDPAGFEPATFGLEVRRPIQARLRVLFFIIYQW